ncbi:MAG: hypothetical protein LBL93_01085 [Ruminococcus sp.]|jgi:hypothetical protein|nr:hypothetical protein [Ruminococcus sp.]
MNISKVNSIFTLFSGETDVNSYQIIIQNAIDDITRRLKSDECLNDERVPFLCASLANLRYKKFTADNDKFMYTFAGKANREPGNSKYYDFAESLFKEYVAAASDILIDTDFCFTQIN